jgi:plastocyanin
MRAAIAAGVLACALAATSGCGSSRSASSGSTTSGGRSTPAGAIHVNTTPKFVVPPAGGTVRSGLVQIAMRNVTLSPVAIRVKAGSKIRWTNFDSLEHNVTSVGGPQRLSSGNFGEGGSYEVQLTRPGVIHYLCTNHPATMNGTIEVVG